MMANGVRSRGTDWKRIMPPSHPPLHAAQVQELSVAHADVNRVVAFVITSMT